MDWLKVLVLSASLIIAGFFIGNMHKTGLAFDRYVTVKGLSEKEVNADLAVWPMNITLTGNNLTSLKSEIDRQSQLVYDFFTAQGFTEEEITRGITTINDALANIYNTQRPEFRYQATVEYTIRTSEIPKLQNALSESLELMSNGILLSSKNTWRPIEYIFTGLNDIKPSMIEEATKNAREVAEKFARDSNSKVGDIRIARQGLFTISNRDENTPQIKVVRVVSTIDFQLKN